MAMRKAFVKLPEKQLLAWADNTACAACFAQ
jgi:hypothetical protein